MNNIDPIVKEILIKGSSAQIWKAITNKDEMKKWYFDLQEFRAELGFRFEFWGETEHGKKYLHLCQITEVIPNEKLSYSWSYDGYVGASLVTFEIIPHGAETLVRLTHLGLETFPSENKDFRKENFNGGWEAIIRDSLKNHVEHYS
jgi:uncharacterized protein YndB with AHSA1/START domain